MKPDDIISYSQLVAEEKANLRDTALRESTFLQSETPPQFLSKAKNNMVAIPGRLLYSTQSPARLCLLAKNKNADVKRGFRDRVEVEIQSALAA